MCRQRKSISSSWRLQRSSNEFWCCRWRVVYSSTRKSSFSLVKLFDLDLRILLKLYRDDYSEDDSTRTPRNFLRSHTTQATSTYVSRQATLPSSIWTNWFSLFASFFWFSRFSFHSLCLEILQATSSVRRRFTWETLKFQAQRNWL